MTRYARTRLSMFVTIGGLIALAFFSLRDGWTEEQVVGSVAACAAGVLFLEFWRTRA